MQSFYQTLSVDAVIIGGGLAALTAAHTCAEAGLSVAIIVKRGLCSGSSFYPLTGALGCQMPRDDVDKNQFYEEICECSAGMQDDALVRLYVEEIRSCLPMLDKIGIHYIIPEGGRTACFATRERTLVNLRELNTRKSDIALRLKQINNIQVFEYTDAVYLVKDENRVAGVIAADHQSRLFYIKSTSTLLATGGYGSLYKHSLNTNDVSGLGQALALEAGADLVNMEFTQFIPGVISPFYKLLFNEFSLRFCEGIFNKHGTNILTKYLPEGVSERECINKRSGHGPFTSKDHSKYFDIAMMSEILRTSDETGFRLQYNPALFKSDNYYDVSYLDFVHSKGVDLQRDSLWVAPFAHAANGGIHIDENGATTVQGLFAAGEVTGGLHGADRHGGNATGNCLVFGRRAAKAMIKRKADRIIAPSDAIAMQQYLEKLDSGKPGCISTDEVLTTIRNVLWKKCNVVRSEAELMTALNTINDIKQMYNAAALISAGTPIPHAVSACGAIITSEALLLAANGRKESRGSHYREDYPNRDDQAYAKRQWITMHDHSLISIIK